MAEKVVSNLALGQEDGDRGRKLGGKARTRKLFKEERET
jgi:hypothetical protein